MTEHSTRPVAPPGATVQDHEIEQLFREVGFSGWESARERLFALCPDERSRRALVRSLPMLLTALSDAATPDGSLVNFERFVQSVGDRAELFEYLADNPRAVEILVKLFVGSQFLTEILLRNPRYLDELTRHKQLAEFKHRGQIIEEARAAVGPDRRSGLEIHGTAKSSDEDPVRSTGPAINEKLDALRRFQHRELLRIGACDAFGLFDLKSVTVQLSLLADSIVQVCLELLAEELDVEPQDFVVLAFGKLGGEELNYSSDIDLVFLCDADAARFWPLGQRLIKALTESTREGFLYRVDMRLRPWGRSGSLVNTVDAHVRYLRQHGMLWEKQALLKARPIAGDFNVGRDFLARAEPLIFGTPADVLRESIREMKERIEAELDRQGRGWGEVKAGVGSIRDVEFVVQYLQLAHGGKDPQVRSIGTLDGLVRLADFGFLHADEYRHLAGGYVFLRTIEHSLQLMHHKQTHSLPEDRRELAWLARRLDYPGADEFLTYYERHCRAVRRIYEKHILGRGEPPAGGEAPDAGETSQRLPELLARMEPSYAETFSEADISRHADLLSRLSSENTVEVNAAPLDDELWQVTIVGYDHPGMLSMMCGMLFVYGFDIVGGEVFSAERAGGRLPTGLLARAFDSFPGAPHDSAPVGRPPVAPGDRKFVDVFVVRPPPEVVLPDAWTRYRSDLAVLLQDVAAGRHREASGQLAKRVAAALRETPDAAPRLYPVDVAIDNEAAEHATALHIESEDTKGFLYELSNALSLAGIDIVRVVIKTERNSVSDTLYVTDAAGEKITGPERQQELRAAVVLIKHFTHLLPRSPNPEQALLQFREFVEDLFRRPGWVQELSALERSDVLVVLARLLGVSNFLWEDFLRLQHENLFPVLADVESLARRKSKVELARELDAELDASGDADDRRRRLNAFKDRELFRTDLRHIMGHIGRERRTGGAPHEETGFLNDFGLFSAELTDLAEVVVAAACRLCNAELRERYGVPLLEATESGHSPTNAGSDVLVGRECALSVCALGKCGGRELGYASDIELMFVYKGQGQTTGPEPVTAGEYFQKLVESFRQTIVARQEGIFQIDLRLRPYGKAGSLAVTLDTFRGYFAPHGAAWPYERQALVKLRPIAGDPQFGTQVEQARDELIYTGEPFDAAAMRAMREKQLTQLVQAGTFNAKLSPGGLVDCEYLVQGLQTTHGGRRPAVRKTNTLAAMAALAEAGVLSEVDYAELREAYITLRRLIDALRVVRGHARDLTVPPADSEEFEFLTQRLGYGSDTVRLRRELERATSAVQELGRLL